MRASVVLCLLCVDCASADLYRLQAGVPEQLTQFELASDVRDPLLALIVGLLDIDAYGGLAPASIDSVVRAHGGSKLPHQELLSVDRRPRAEPSSADVLVSLRRDMNLPVPYSILGYNPGSMAASREFALREWKLEQFRIRVQADDRVQELSFSDVQLFGIVKGWLRMDVDWWLDKLFGSKLDDTQLVGVALITRDGRRLAVAFGYTPAHQGRSGVFDLAKDEVVFPAPRELLTLGRELRREVERRLSSPAGHHDGD